jgi:hypothetical protein
MRDRAVAMTERGEMEILRRGEVVTENPTQGVGVATHRRRPHGA